MKIGTMEQPKPQAILNGWRQVGEHLYGHPVGHPDYNEDTTLGIRPLNPPNSQSQAWLSKLGPLSGV